MKRKTEAKSYLISALRQQRQNKNYVMSRRLLQTRKENWRRKKSYLDRCKKPMSLSFFFLFVERKLDGGIMGTISRIIQRTNGNQLLISDPGDYGTRKRKKIVLSFFLMRRKENRHPLFKIRRLMEPENVTHTHLRANPERNNQSFLVEKSPSMSDFLQQKWQRGSSKFPEMFSAVLTNFIARSKQAQIIIVIVRNFCERSKPEINILRYPEKITANV